MSEQTASIGLERAPMATSRRRTGVVQRSLGYRRTAFGLALVALVVLAALIGPAFAPHGPSEVIGRPIQAPSSAWPLGTDSLGRDVLSRVLWGGRTVVWMAFASATLGVALGAGVGMVAGYARGWLDGLLMRVMDVVLAFPQLVLALLFVSFLGPKLWLIVLLVACTWTPQVARVVRGVTLEVVHREYIELAEALGVSRRRIVVREILPNVSTPLAVEFALKLTWSIALVAAISFLGFGIQPPNADWGLMISENRGVLTQQPWPVLAPAALIAVFALGANLAADGVARAVGRVGDGEDA